MRCITSTSRAYARSDRSCLELTCAEALPSLGQLPVGLTQGPLHCASFLRQYASGIGPIAAPHLAPNPMASQSAQSKFCRPEEDPFLLLDRASRSIEQLLRRDLPLRRTWSEQPYGEEEITLLEEEVLPAIAQCLARIDAIDSALSAAGEELYRQEVLAAAQKCRVLLPGEVALI